ncbi:hypothetical protein HDV05_001500 [Chytridiales sp. JEL 0842]|nr:hypothetical protein HDV05_001500 [Chytridiales sp. JEL 0842]
MRLLPILSLFSTLVALSSAAVPDFTNKIDSPHRVPNVYALHFPIGVDAEAAVRKALEPKGLEVVVRVKQSGSIANLISFEVKGKYLNSDILSIPDAQQAHYVNRVFRAQTVDVAPRADQAKPELIHSLTGVNFARNNLGLTGKGIKVGVIDSGVYYLHPALGGCFGPGCRVESGYDFVGDEGPFPMADEDPLDSCSSSAHGSHVSGIIGANALEYSSWPQLAQPAFPFTGVAPNVTIGAYRVFNCAGGGATDAVLAAAIYKAAEDKCHVINMSLGSGPTYGEDLHGIAAERVSKAGHFVVGSNGNDGAAGIFSQGGVGNTISIGSFDNLEQPGSVVKIDGKAYPFSPGSANASFPKGENVWDYVITDPDNKTPQDGCGAPFTVSPKGKVAIIRFGISGEPGYCGSGARCNAAAAAGATACIVYAPTPAPLNIAGSALIPSASISLEAGQAFLAAYKANRTAQASYNPDVKELLSIATAGTPSGFSSWGLSPDLEILPDVSGIGGFVYSTVSPAAVPPGDAYYNVLSGTSMSAPYISGTIALLLEAYPNLTLEEVKSRLMTTANPSAIYESPLTPASTYDSVAKQGNGLVEISNAVLTKTLITPASISLNDTKRIHQHYRVDFKNLRDVEVTYFLSHEPAASVYTFSSGDDIIPPTSKSIYATAAATVNFRQSVKVNANSVGSLRIQFQPPTGLDASRFPIYSGYIKITNDQDDIVQRVAYAGVVGDWTQSPTFSTNSPSLNAAVKASPIIQAIGFSENSTASVGAYIPSEDGYRGLTPQAAGESLPAISQRDAMLLLAPFSTTTRGFRVEAEYVGTNGTMSSWIRSLGGSNVGRNATMVLDVLQVSLPPGSPSLSLIPMGAFLMPLTPRNTASAAQTLALPDLYLWSGKVWLTEDSFEPVDLPEGEWRIKFEALKHFRRVGGSDDDYEVVRNLSIDPPPYSDPIISRLLSTMSPTERNLNLTGSLVLPPEDDRLNRQESLQLPRTQTLDRTDFLQTNLSSSGKPVASKRTASLNPTQNATLLSLSNPDSPSSNLSRESSVSSLSPLPSRLTAPPRRESTKHGISEGTLASMTEQLQSVAPVRRDSIGRADSLVGLSDGGGVLEAPVRRESTRHGISREVLVAMGEQLNELERKRSMKNGGEAVGGRDGPSSQTTTQTTKLVAPPRAQSVNLQTVQLDSTLAPSAVSPTHVQSPISESSTVKTRLLSAVIEAEEVSDSPESESEVSSTKGRESVDTLKRSQSPQPSASVESLDPPQPRDSISSEPTPRPSTSSTSSSSSSSFISSTLIRLRQPSQNPNSTLSRLKRAALNPGYDDLSPTSQDSLQQLQALHQDPPKEPKPKKAPFLQRLKEAAANPGVRRKKTPEEDKAELEEELEALKGEERPLVRLKTSKRRVPSLERKATLESGRRASIDLT